MHTPIHPSTLPPLPTPPAQRPHRKLFTFHFSLFTSASASAASLPAIAALALALSLPPAARAQAAAAADYDVNPGRISASNAVSCSTTNSCVV